MTSVSQTTERTAAPVLEVRSLSKRFGGLLAVSDVSFSVADRAITALIGPNGAGKTTVFNLVSNVFPADAGEVIYLGRPVGGLNPVEIAKLGLIRTFQSARVFPGLTALENVLVGHHRLVRCSGLTQMLWTRGSRREEAELRARALELLDLVGLARLADVHAIDLPMGNQKLLEVIRGLMARPRLLCLDEPAAGLNDTETEELATLLRAIRSSGIPVLIVEHNMTLVMDVADHVVVLEAGAVIGSGAPVEMQRNPKVIEAYLGSVDDAAA